MKPISDIHLRWYDDSTLAEDNPRKLAALFMDAIGVTSDVAVDLFEVLLISRAGDNALTSREIKTKIMESRKKRKTGDHGLTDRNIQVWLKFFRELKLVDRTGSHYRFRGNKKPSEAYMEYTKPLVYESAEYVERLLLKVEESYGIE